MTLEEFEREVRRLTEQNIKVYPTLVENGIMLPYRGRGYELDHKISIRDAWLRGWTPAQTAAWSNLRVITEAGNRKKGSSSLF